MIDSQPFMYISIRKCVPYFFLKRRNRLICKTNLLSRALWVVFDMGASYPRLPLRNALRVAVEWVSFFKMWHNIYTSTDWLCKYILFFPNIQILFMEFYRFFYDTYHIDKEN